MSVKKPKPGPGQADFGFELPPSTEVVVLMEADPDALAAFGGLLKTGLYDVFGDYDITNVTDEEKAWMCSGGVGDSLLAASVDDEFTVDRIALSPLEYDTVMRTRNPRRFGQTLVGRNLDEADEVDDELNARAHRSGFHLLEAERQRMSNHRELMEARRAEIAALFKEAKKPGYGHYPRAQMISWFNSAWQEFSNMLDAVRWEREWDDDKRQRADAALIAHLTTGGQRVRVAHWRRWLTLADGYLGARIHLFRSREKIIENYLKENEGIYGYKMPDSDELVAPTPS